MIKKWSSRWIDTTQYKNKDLLLQIVGERVKRPGLKKANKTGTAYVCFCPFHNEKTPSFKLHNNNGRSRTWAYKCFGCGASGDVFSFLMRFERWEFWEALAYLKKHAISRSPLSSVFDKNQLKIPFPMTSNGQYFWVSPDMRQIGYT